MLSQHSKNRKKFHRDFRKSSTRGLKIGQKIVLLYYNSLLNRHLIEKYMQST